MPVIYKYTFQSTKSYIGQTVQNPDVRHKQHLREAKEETGKCHALNNAIRKYEGQFTTEIIKECKKEDLDYYETYYIKFYNTLVPNGYNLTSGGSGNRPSEKVNRYRSYAETADLPQYIQRKSIDDYTGYAIINHPSCTFKAFFKKDKTLEENLIDAKEFLEQLNNGTITVESREKKDLPKGLQQTAKGYRVEIKKDGKCTLKKTFENQRVPLEERYKQALLVMEKERKRLQEEYDKERNQLILNHDTHETINELADLVENLTTC